MKFIFIFFVTLHIFIAQSLSNVTQSISGFNNSSWTNIAYVTGSHLASSIRLSLKGTTGNVVVSVVADITVNHSQDMFIRTRSGSYTQVTLRLLSNGNDSYYIQAKTNSLNSVTLRCDISSNSGEIITFNPTNASGTNILEHICKLHGESISSTGGATPNYYVNGFEVHHKGNLATAEDLNAKENYTTVINGFDKHHFKTIALVEGSRLASSIRLSLKGTAGNVVVSTVADIIVNHHSDIVIKSRSGVYQKVILRVKSNNNDKFIIQAKLPNAYSSTPLRIDISPNSGEKVTFGSTTDFNSTVLEHDCQLQGESMSGTNGSNDEYYLTVKGTISAKKVKVTSTPGADFVFENDYKLRSLAEIEKFIKKNKHLPEIPPAKEMETNGLDMSEFQIKLLQKIEELTLHVIELKKENVAQSKKIKELESTKK